MPTLRELKAGFRKYRPEPGSGGIYEPRATLAEADGVRFLCPKCYQGPQFPHPVFIGFEGRATPGTYGHNSKGEPVLWQLVSGSSLDDLVLSPSIQIEGGCNWHGFVGSSGVTPGSAA